MQTTTNYQLKKPEGTDIVNIEDLNGNFDVIDTQLAGRENLLKNAAAKTSLVDADTMPLSDSAASSGTKKITFANLKKVLKAYFDTLYNKYTHPSYTAKAAGLYKVTVDATGHVSATAAVAKADITALGIPASNTTYAAMKAATSSAAGAAGLVPAPAAGAQTKFLRGDGTWQTPTNTTYAAMTAATSSAAGKAGLVPAPAAGAQAKFLRGDGTWQTPTYSGVVSVANGGTGAKTLTSGAALIGAGTNAVTTRTIRNNTATSSSVTADTALITSNTLRYAINRTTSVAASDTNYTTKMARGISFSSTIPDSIANGQIVMVYV